LRILEMIRMITMYRRLTRSLDDRKMHLHFWIQPNDAHALTREIGVRSRPRVPRSDRVTGSKIRQVGKPESADRNLTVYDWTVLT
jgi:hypothetical protein